MTTFSPLAFDERLGQFHYHQHGDRVDPSTDEVGSAAHNLGTFDRGRAASYLEPGGGSGAGAFGIGNAG